MWRTVIINYGEKLIIRNNTLVVFSAGSEYHIPVDDIYALVIDNRQALLSVSVVTSLTKAGAHIFYCDERHISVSVTFALNTHYRPLNVPVLINGRKTRIRYAIDVYVKSLVSAINGNNPDLLSLPELIPIDTFFEDDD